MKVLGAKGNYTLQTYTLYSPAVLAIATAVANSSTCAGAVRNMKVWTSSTVSLQVLKKLSSSSEGEQRAECMESCTGKGLNGEPVQGCLHCWVVCSNWNWRFVKVS